MLLIWSPATVAIVLGVKTLPRVFQQASFRANLHLYKSFAVPEPLLESKSSGGNIIRNHELPHRENPEKRRAQFPLIMSSFTEFGRRTGWYHWIPLNDTITDIPPLTRHDGLIQLTIFEDIQFWAKPFKFEEEVIMCKGWCYLAAIVQQLLKLYIVWRLFFHDLLK